MRKLYTCLEKAKRIIGSLEIPVISPRRGHCVEQIANLLNAVRHHLPQIAVPNELKYFSELQENIWQVAWYHKGQVKIMDTFEIVAHRGITTEEPENTLPAFLRAVEMGADAIELDVRLTSDHVPIVYHYYYLNTNTPINAAIFECSYKQLRDVQVLGNSDINPHSAKIRIISIIRGRVGNGP